MTPTPACCEGPCSCFGVSHRCGSQFGPASLLLDVAHMAVGNSDASVTANTGGYAILYVDDEEQALKYFARAFGGRFNVLTAPSVDRALDVLKDQHHRVAILLTDQKMPGGSGVELLTKVRQQYPKVLRLIVTAYADLDSAIAAVNEGAVYKYLTKPLELVQTRRVINEAMATFMASRELDAMTRAESDQIERLALADQVRHVAAMTTGLARQVREGTTAINRLFDELHARGAATATTHVSAEPPVAAATRAYLNQMFQLADVERERLAAFVREVDVRLARSQIQFDGPFKLADLLTKQRSRRAWSSGTRAWRRRSRVLAVPRCGPMPPRSCECSVPLPSKSPAAGGAARG